MGNEGYYRLHEKKATPPLYPCVPCVYKKVYGEKQSFLVYTACILAYCIRAYMRVVCVYMRGRGVYMRVLCVYDLLGSVYECNVTRVYCTHTFTTVALFLIRTHMRVHTRTRTLVGRTNTSSIAAYTRLLDVYITLFTFQG